MRARNISKNRNLLRPIILIACLMGMFPAAVSAASEHEFIESSEPPMVENFNSSGDTMYVNGVDILTAAENTVSCGSGTAVYDASSSTLTLNNAEIDTASPSLTGIALSDSIAELHIVLQGHSTIAGTTISQGIYTMGNLSISGSGSLAITTLSEATAYSLPSEYILRV